MAKLVVWREKIARFVVLPFIGVVTMSNNSFLYSFSDFYAWYSERRIGFTALHAMGRNCTKLKHSYIYQLIFCSSLSIVVPHFAGSLCWFTPSFTQWLNKAWYMAEVQYCSRSWAGGGNVKTAQKTRKKQCVTTNGPMDQLTNQPTNRRTDGRTSLVTNEVACKWQEIRKWQWMICALVSNRP